MNESLHNILAALVFFTFGLGLILLIHLTSKKRKYIKKYGIITEGEIIDSRTFYTPEKNVYYISCKYITKHNEEIKKEFHDVSYDKSYISRHPIGSKIKIIYLPEAPNESIIKYNLLDLVLFFAQLIGIGLIGLGIYFLYDWLILYLL